MAALYGCEYIQDLIQKYVDKGGAIATIKEVVLGYGTTILYGEKLKTVVIKEICLNEWSSAHKIKMYNKCPKKYMKMIEDYENNGVM